MVNYTKQDMKIIKMVGWLFLFTGATLNKAGAQGTGGFFNQQSSKEKLMAAQILEYETFLKELKSGYSTTQKGLNTAHELKNGTFTLHQDYFNSLKQVAPAVSSDPKIKGIADLLSAIEQTFDLALSWQKDKAILTTNEISYIQSIYSSLLIECSKKIDELKLAVTPGQVQMTDQQRLSEIDGIYSDMQQKYRFACAFTRQTYGLANARITDQTGQQALKQLYHINN
jgi:hypothetical protein